MFRIYCKKNDSVFEYNENYTLEKHNEICEELGVSIKDTDVIFPIDVLIYPSGNIKVGPCNYGLMCVNWDELPFSKFRPVYSEENGNGGSRIYDIPVRYFYNVEKRYQGKPKYIKVLTDRTCSQY